MRHHILPILAATLLAAPALAADPAPIADEHRLSAAEVQQILDTAATRPAVPALADIADGSDTPAARQVHGEMGFAIGTGGYREAFGTAVVPLGSDGVAILSFDTADFGNRYRRRR
jgi:hypothetical protein